MCYLVITALRCRRPRFARRLLAFAINVAACAEAERIFKALADGAKINMPFGKTFWSDGFGMLVDRFGTPWMVGVAQSQS